MATIIFWVLMVAIICFVFRKTSIWAYDNVNGLEEINGKMEKTGDTDHYTGGMVYISYYALAIFFLLLFYILFAGGLDYFGLADKYEVTTGYRQFLELWFRR